MKKLIALLLIAVLALSAAACSSQPAGTEAPAEGTEAAAPADGAKVVKIGVFEPASGDNGAGRQAGDPWRSSTPIRYSPPSR